MASGLVKMATNDKLKETDWAKNIEICELVSHDPGKAKDVMKSIKKRLQHKSPNTQLYAVMLLEMLMNNFGENIHKLVVENAILPILVKIVKKKTNDPVRERIFLLLDATQTAVGGAKGKFPEYYAAYYDLVVAGVEFANRPRVTVTELQPLPAQRKIPSHPATATTTEDNSLSQRLLNDPPPMQANNLQNAPDSSIIKKATSVLEILRDVLSSIDTKHPEGAMDEFVLDLVEQCSFQKQRVMHLVMTSRDEMAVTEAIELNEELHKVLLRHDSLLSLGPTSTATSFINNSVDNNTNQQEEEDAESLYKRLRKGKALSVDYTDESIRHPFGSITEEMLRRPLIRPLKIQPDPKPDPEPKPTGPAFSIPPPPAKHVERERFFREKSSDHAIAGLPGQMQGLSLHSRDGSSSCSGSTDYGD
ncbi:Target of Myb protein 1 [Rhynchospora pubera]|uniref:Target of Myb protein 1 n=1 Tax=Rhynchospora pubera TaxID=906938 RepID=A0AAV8EUM3_9POAL|nr:Target of Myb protein 1 [Rhynchospora pubera]